MRKPILAVVTLLVTILDREISAQEGQLANAVELVSQFDPTAEIQEISMANG